MGESVRNWWLAESNVRFTVPVPAGNVADIGERTPGVVGL
jgi:hypothetical protein